MTTTTPNDTKQRPEEQCVARWRFSRLRRAGYGPHAAAELARRSDVDLHLAVGLLENGCPVDTALAILF
jgi:hypothetical protein